MTESADRFTDEILVSWDHLDCWERTAAEGLSEVDEATLGLGDLVGPVSGGEQVPGAGHLLTPGGGVPAGALEGDGKVQRGSGS